MCVCECNCEAKLNDYSYLRRTGLESGLAFRPIRLGLTCLAWPASAQFDLVWPGLGCFVVPPDPALTHSLQDRRGLWDVGRHRIFKRSCLYMRFEVKQSHKIFYTGKVIWWNVLCAGTPGMLAHHALQHGIWTLWLPVERVLAFIALNWDLLKSYFYQLVY